MVNITLSSEIQVVFPLCSGKRLALTSTIVSIKIWFGFSSFSSLVQENCRKAVKNGKVG